MDLQYRIEEMPDLHKDGKRKVKARPVNYQQINFKTVLENWKTVLPNSTFNEATIKGVLSELRYQLDHYMELGHSVKVDDLFVTSLSITNKNGAEEVKAEGERYDTNGFYIKGVNFHTDSKWVKEIQRNTRLVKVDKVKTLRDIKTTKEERLEIAKKWMSENGGHIRVARYESLTGLSHTAACKELKSFSRDSESGISTEGRGCSLVYVLKNID